MSLITTILNPPDDGQSLHKYKKAMKKRKNKGRKLVESAEREQRPLQSVYHHYYTRIGELFFLKQRYLCINKFLLYTVYPFFLKCHKICKNVENV